MQDAITQVLKDYPLFAPLFFIILRAITVVVSPIPGIFVDIPGIVAFGWLLSFVYAEIGILLGSMIAFWIARRYRDPLIKRFAPLQAINDWEKKLSENQKFWTLVAIRIPAIPFFDYINYAAGLTTISSVRFFFSTLLGNIPFVFLTFYFGGLSLEGGKYYFIAFFVLLILLSLVYGKRTSFKC
jgi:uncharacterized membrane protein YdjX (TVP38/TMEM64 family)